MNKWLLLVLLYVRLIVVYSEDKFAWVLYGDGFIWWDYMTDKPVDAYNGPMLQQLKSDDGKFTWPSKYPIHFFVEHGVKLSVDVGDNIFDQFKLNEGFNIFKWNAQKFQVGTTLKKNKAGLYVNVPFHQGNIPLSEETRYKGGGVYDYHLYPAFDTAGSTQRTGIFLHKWTKVKGKWLHEEKRQYDVESWTQGAKQRSIDNPISLKQFLDSKEYKEQPAPIYWIACREKLIVRASRTSSIASDTSTQSTESVIRKAHRDYNNAYNGYEHYDNYKSSELPGYNQYSQSNTNVLGMLEIMLIVIIFILCGVCMVINICVGVMGYLFGRQQERYGKPNSTDDCV